MTVFRIPEPRDGYSRGSAGQMLQFYFCERCGAAVAVTDADKRLADVHDFWHELQGETA